MVVDTGVRHVACYCGKAQVVTRRPPEFDKFAICSPDCFAARRRANVLTPEEIAVPFTREGKG